MADPNSFVYVVAQIKPAEGKAEEVPLGLFICVIATNIEKLLEGMAVLAGEVEKNEPGCLSYQFFFSEKEYEIQVFEM